MGLEEGMHHIGQFSIEVRGGRAYVAGTNTLCGSITPLNDCIKIFKKASGSFLKIKLSIFDIYL